MDENDIQELKNINKRIRNITAKIKLLCLLRRAKEEYDKNNYKECYQTCRDILKTEPENPIALRGLGCVMHSLDKFKPALKYYQKALKFSQNKEIEYTLLGNLYYEQEDLDKAIEYFNLAIDTNDDYDSAYEGRNQAMLENHVKILDLQDKLIKNEFLK